MLEHYIHAWRGNNDHRHDNDDVDGCDLGNDCHDNG